MHLEIISNGLGAPSMKLLTLAAEGFIPARVSITADTGSEEDRLWSTGERTSAKEFFTRVVLPYCKRHDIKAYFVRARDKNNHPMPSLWEMVKRSAEAFERDKESLRIQRLFIPLFGSDGGRLRQTCTSRWKVAAIRQKARRLGAETLRSAQGIHFDEAWRRVSGVYTDAFSDWDTYHDVDRKKDGKPIAYTNIFGEDVGIKTDGGLTVVKYATHYYPLVQLQMGRQAIRDELDSAGLPYLITSECDHCPHKDLPRWQRTSPEVIQEVAQVEAKFGGKFFFTDERIPLLDAIALKQRRSEFQGNLFADDSGFACTDGVCGV